MLHAKATSDACNRPKTPLGPPPRHVRRPPAEHSRADLARNRFAPHPTTPTSCESPGRGAPEDVRVARGLKEALAQCPAKEHGGEHGQHGMRHRHATGALAVAGQRSEAAVRRQRRQQPRSVRWAREVCRVRGQGVTVRQQVWQQQQQVWQEHAKSRGVEGEEFESASAPALSSNPTAPRALVLPATDSARGGQGLEDGRRHPPCLRWSSVSRRASRHGEPRSRRTGDDGRGFVGPGAAATGTSRISVQISSGLLSPVFCSSEKPSSSKTYGLLDSRRRSRREILGETGHILESLRRTASAQSETTIGDLT